MTYLVPGNVFFFIIVWLIICLLVGLCLSVFLYVKILGICLILRFYLFFHTVGLLISDHRVDSDEALKTWKISVSPECIVTRVQEECTEDYCEMMCLELSCIGLCQHLYMCSCPDGNTLCQHKHKVGDNPGRGGEGGSMSAPVYV